jgi:hypothetical protein
MGKLLGHGTRGANKNGACEPGGSDDFAVSANQLERRFRKIVGVAQQQEVVTLH